MSRNQSEIGPKSDETIVVGSAKFNPKDKSLQSLDGKALDLRNQSLEVLAFLAARAGQVVSKEELFEAVWGETHVTDDSLVQCITEIRRVIEDVDRKVVQTLPRQGYRLNPNADDGRASRAGEKRQRQTLMQVAAALCVAVFAVTGWLIWQNDAPDLGDRPRIAVLPFDDFSVGEDKGYLSDAIAEGIITELARSRTYAVIARNSSFRYRETDTDLRQIGEELGVHYILEGSQQKSGVKLRVTAQLIDAASGEHIWAHTYEQEIGELFVVQDAIVRTAADRVGRRIAAPVPTGDPDKVTALHYYLLGRAAIHEEFNSENNAILFEMNRKAIEVDPDSHFGYMGLAFAYRHAASFGWQGLDSDEAIQKGLENGLKALEIAPDDPEVHYALARLYGESGDTEASMARFSKAIELNPSASNFLVASTTPMLYRGQTEEAITRLNQAMGIDPFHPDWYHWQMGWALWEKNQCDDALASMMRMNKIPKGAQRMRAGIYACIGDTESAQSAYKVYYEDADEPTIAEQRDEWKDIWTAPGSLDRWLDHMKIAGMKE